MSSYVSSDKRKEFKLEFFKYVLKYLGVFRILLTRIFEIDTKKLLKWFEMISTSVIVSLSIFRLILLKDFLLFTLIIDRMPSHNFLKFFLLSSNNDL